MEVSPEILRLPKVELHEHLDGSLRPSTILELAQQGNVRLPTTDLGTLKSILSPGPSSLEVYLQAFSVTTSVMQTKEALHRVAREVVEDWADDGLVYGEIRFAPEQHTREGLSPEAVVEAVLGGLAEGTKTWGVETGLILCSMRHAPATLDTARLVHRYRNDGVVGFDLAGAEAPYPPSLHREAFEFCAEQFLATTCHAGEVTGPEYIREALTACRALRIGHGTQLIQEWGEPRRFPDSGSVTRWIHDRRIPLEMCLTSNLQTKACERIDHHPFGDFRREGLVAVLCTDNRLVSDTRLSQELAIAQKAWNLSIVELKQVQRQALEASFASQEKKSRILAKHFS